MSAAQPPVRSGVVEPLDLTSGLIAPRRGIGQSGRIWEGVIDRKPWSYRVTAVIPVLDTPDQLAVCVRVLRAQTESPYILVIDTGSMPHNLAAIEAMRADDLEVHQIRSHGWRHASEPVAVACQLGQDLSRTEFAFQTHADCFLMRQDLLAEWAVLSRQHGVVSYQISPRVYPGWQTEIGHTALMMHLPTIRKAGVRWNMASFCERFGDAPVDLSLGVNRPDTESEMNASLADAGIQPLILGTEENRQRNTNADFDHPRSFCSSLFLDRAYHREISGPMQCAMREAIGRAASWEAAQ